MTETSPTSDELLKRAIVDLRTMRSKLDALERAKAEPVAVIGMGCRFPGGAATPEAFWRLLAQGVDAISEVPAERWDVDALYDPDPDAPGKLSTRWGGFLDEVGSFDAEFFRMSPREAGRTDPQQRLLLEVSWEALERAGQAPDKLAGSPTGVFVGICSNEYAWPQVAERTRISAYTGTGTAYSIVANRLSYLLDLRGPSVALDTACSSSLVAVHLACQSLRAGECSLALAGGVNLVLFPEGTIALSKLGMMAPDGRCKTFDARADGFVRGEGCGLVVLKRLGDALKDGDPVWALVRGSAINQDGRSAGLTAPNLLSQKAVLRKALEQAGVEPSRVSYVETHGTGTSLGDPIEIEALTEVIGAPRPRGPRCALGSVKTNIGHAEAAAGVAGLIKAVLALQHGQIPPHLHLRELNPNISLESTPFFVPTELGPWPEGGERRYAGVSSFGFGGTNAHVILEAAVPREPAPPQVERPCHLLCLSATGEGALAELAGRYASHLAAHPATSLADVCHTAAAGRSHFAERLAVVAESPAEAREKLTAAGETPPGVIRGRRERTARNRIAFLMTGQGSQYPGMGRRLYETQPTFRRTLERCDELLRPHLERPLISVLHAEPGEGPALDDTAFTQPALFALEVALAELWISWGIRPAAVIGHSVGEYAAACVAGVMSLEDGLLLIAERGRIMQELESGGEMAAVFAGERQVSEALRPHAAEVSVAALNGPRETVVSGTRTALAKVLGELAEAGVRSRRLAVSHAFHSPLVEPILERFERRAGEVAFSAPRIPLISNLSGRPATAEEITQASYWRRHAREPVRFADGVAALSEKGCEVLLEVGPQATMLAMARKCLADGEALFLPSLRRGRDDWRQLLASLGALYARGAPVDWAGFDRDYPRRRVDLPTYPFQRRRHWIEAPTPVSPAPPPPSRDGAHPLLGPRLDTALTETLFESRLTTDSPSFLADHQVYGRTALPAAAYLEMSLASAAEVLGPGQEVVEDLLLEDVLVLSEGEARSVQTVVTPEGPGKASVRILSRAEGRGRAEGAWTLHASGRLRHSLREDAEPPQSSLDELRARCREELPAADFYGELRRAGLFHGPGFQGIEQLWCAAGESLGRIRLPRTPAAEAAAYRLHPALLDAGLQLVAAAVLGDGKPAGDPQAYLPIALASFRLHRAPGVRSWGRAVLRRNLGAPGETLTADLDLIGEDGRPVAELRGLALRRVAPETLERAAGKHPGDTLYELLWRPGERGPAPELDPAGSWLIFADWLGVGARLAEHLSERGADCTLVFPGEGYKYSEEGFSSVDPARPGDFRSLLGEVPGCRGVVHLWGLEKTSDADPTPASLEEAQRLGCGSVLHLVQALAGSRRAPAPGLWLVTRGTQAVEPLPATPPAVAQAPLWGLGRVIALEHPELRCTRVDLDPEGDEEEEARSLFEELGSEDREDQVAFRHGARHVARLVRGAPAADPREGGETAAAGRPVRLALSARGTLDELALEPAPRRPPGDGEVEIRVRATGLNFRDVLSALGMYPGDAGPPGGECAGEIAAVGPGVTELEVGDEVLAMAAGSFATFATTPAALVAAKPRPLSFEAAATVPIAFLTAGFGLDQLARIRRGERVLIHAAAGGVGMAAVQLARRAGAEVYATASPAKWPVLEKMGVERLMSSRSLDFAAEVMEKTGGRGVDVVLNSLAEEFIPRSLSVLAPGGRFVEIGKRGILSPDEAAELRGDVSYFVFDLAETTRREPERVSALLRELVAEVGAGTLEPLPRTVLPLGRVRDAFRTMAQAKHTGKIVVSQEAGESASLRGDATYLITGGLGALGLEVARWMVEHGARRLVLMGRHGASERARELSGRLAAAGAQVVVAEGDVSRERDVARVLAEIEPPLAGVVHAAGVLGDGVLTRQDWPRFAEVMAPKVAGAWNLHRLTREAALDFFVGFSSAAALLGSPGQGNYAAANAFLDTLAHHRRARGLPASSIAWGPWAGAGMAGDDRDPSRWSSRGIGALTPDRALAALATVLAGASPHLAVLAIDWRRFRSSFPAGGTPPLISELTGGAQESAESEPAPPPELGRRLREAPPGERRDLLEAHLRAQASRVLGLDSACPPEPDVPLQELGLDSLMAVELRNALAASLGEALPATLLFDFPTLGAVADHLLRDVLDLEPSPAPAAPETAPPEAREPIAIVGMACRFPGADDPEAFWQLLRDGVDAISEVPPDRWDVDALYDPDPDAPGKMSTRYGGFLDGVDRFDDRFFGISPREAVSMDPQQRLLLEVSWQALESAGQAPERLAGTAAGVFVGISTSDYAQVLLQSGGPAAIDAYFGTGNTASVAAGRLSYHLGLEGPCLAIDTACSSSLVALHSACQSLRAGECTLALVGAVNAMLSPEATINFSKARMMAPDGRCKTFDRAADGYVRSEGCGVVVAKRLSDALRNGDPVLAVIRGSAVNQDGRSNGLTAPNGPAQEAVLRKALAQAGVAPSEVGFVEAHGTGTALGDPIEVQALGHVLGADREAGQRLLIGSVKTNVGHLEAAAGMAGLIKVVLALSHAEIPPHLHFVEPNPHIPWDRLPVEVPTRLRPWPAGGRRIAGVSSFGFSGTNAHVVLEAAAEPAAREPEVERPLHLLGLSAKDDEALRELASRYGEHLAKHPELAPGDVGATAGAGRSQFAHRLALVAPSVPEMAEGLAAWARGEEPAGAVSGARTAASRPRVAFLFTGQGAQYTGMGRRLYDTQPSFRQTLERCDEILRPHLEQPLLSVLFAPPGEVSPLDETAYTQPALFALEVALAELWISWGIRPAVVMGHSVGEYAAACVAGVFSLEDGLELIAARGRLMQELPRDGEMAAVFAAGEQVVEALSPHAAEVSVAALNGPRETVISGRREALSAVLEELAAAGVRSRRLAVSHAFHSPLVEPMLESFEQRAAEVELRAPQISLVSNLSGRPAAPEEITRASYWRRHAREPVRFAESVATLRETGCEALVEIGPQATLLAMARKCLAASSEETLWLPSLRRGRDDWRQMLASLAAVYVAGAAVDWPGFDRDYPRRRVALPSYPFRRRRCWPAGRGSAPPPRKALGECLYEVAWQPRQPLPDRAPETPGGWLVFADGGGVGRALAKLLEERGEAVELVFPGEVSGRAGERHRQLDPGRPDDWKRLIVETLPAPGEAPRYRGMVHLWSLDAPPAETLTASSLGSAQAVACGSVLHLVQALAEAGRPPLPRLSVVTRGVQAVESGDPAPSVAQAPMWGLGRVVASEHPELWEGLIDVGAGDPEAVAASLLQEIRQPGGEDQVAWRGSRRYVARLRPATSWSGSEEPLSLKPESAYLVTGGLGALGLGIARWMVERGARHLVLAGRGAPSESATRVLDELEQAGAEVVVERADVSRPADVERLLARFGTAVPALAGVVHAAGVLGDAALLRQDWERFAGVLAPKVQGAWNLHAMSRSARLDFFVLFSSAAALLGSAGQGNYAAANAFLDALAHHRRALGRPATSVAWGPWADAGMAADADRRGGLRSRTLGIEPIRPAEGLALFDRLLSGAPAHVAVVPVRWEKLRGEIPTGREPPLLAEVLGELGGAGREARPPQQVSRRLLQMPAGQRQASLRAYLRERIARALATEDEIRDGHDLLELGMDSLMVIEVLRDLDRDLGLTVYPRELYERPSIEALASHLGAELGRRESDTEAAPPPGSRLEALGLTVSREARPAPAPAARGRGVDFLLSGPRTGSTLLRVMLAGHPALFCPPELHLLPFDDLGERRRRLGASYLGEGLERALMELEGLDGEASRERVRGLVERSLPVPEVYALLRELAEPRRLLDKSPTYAVDAGTLRRAEELFDGARYVCLARHPYAMIESFVRRRMDKLLGAGGGDAHLLAEEIWATAYANVLDFFAELDHERCHLLRFEDLVSQPEESLRRLCDFLAIPFEAALLEPYEGRRMTDGVHARSLAIGDPGFLARRRIDPTLGEAWKAVRLPHELGEAAREVAAALSYDLPAETKSATAVPGLSGDAAAREVEVEVRGLRLSVCRWGPDEGPLILCLHGILEHGAAWELVAGPLAERGYRVLAPDLRGHGRSEHLARGGSYHLVDFLADVDGLVRQLGNGPLTLVGHSMGAALAALFAAVRPQQVEALVLVESPVPPVHDEERAGEKLAVHLDYLATPPRHAVFPDLDTAAERLCRAVPSMPRPTALRMARRITEPCPDGGLQWRWDPLLLTRAGMNGGGIELSLLNGLSHKTRAPVLWVRGDRSRHARPKDLARLRAMMPKAREIVLPGEHHLHYERPGAVAEIIAEAAAVGWQG